MHDKINWSCSGYAQEFHRLYLEDPLTHGKVIEPLHRHRDLPKVDLSLHTEFLQSDGVSWDKGSKSLRCGTKHGTSGPPKNPLPFRRPGLALAEKLSVSPSSHLWCWCWGNHIEHGITLLQTLHHIVCCSGSFWAQGGISVVKSSWGILLLWISPDDLLHPDKLTTSSVSVFFSSAPCELKNHFTLFVPNMQLDSLVLDKKYWTLLTSSRPLGIWSIKSGILCF